MNTPETPEGEVVTVAVLDRAAVGALYDPPLTAAAIKTRQRRYPPGHPDAFPAPVGTANGGPVWLDTQIEELRAWKGAGRGAGGGRPWPTSRAHNTTEKGAEAHAADTGDTSGTDQPTPDPFAPLAPLRPIDDQATSDVFHNLQRQKGNGDIWGTAGETFSFTSREVYREQAMSWLGENSELSSRTIRAADWNEVFDYFRGVRYPDTAPEPTPALETAPEPEPFADRRLSDDPAHAGMTNLGQIIAFDHQRTKEKRAAERLEAKHRKTMGAPTVTDPATAVKVSVDVVEPGKAVIVGPGFQARAGIDTTRKSRRYWVELTESDDFPRDVEGVIGYGRTYAAAGEVAADWHRLANYYVEVDHEK